MAGAPWIIDTWVNLLPPVAEHQRDAAENVFGRYGQLDVLREGTKPVGLISPTSLLAAEDAPAKQKKTLTPEQKQLRKEMVEKYDANKDGKLDKEEKAKMSQEDKGAWSKAFPPKKKKGGEDAAASKAEGDK